MISIATRLRNNRVFYQLFVQCYKYYYYYYYYYYYSICMVSTAFSRPCLHFDIHSSSNLSRIEKLFCRSRENCIVITVRHATGGRTIQNRWNSGSKLLGMSIVKYIYIYLLIGLVSLIRLRTYTYILPPYELNSEAMLSHSNLCCYLLVS